MARAPLLSLLAAALLGPACLPQSGTAPADPVDAGTPDAEVPDAAPPDAEPQAVCAPGQIAEESGHHFSGESCTSVCHDGVNGPRWTLAGTLYDDEFGSHIVAGATIHLRAADGAAVTLVTARNGNFWTNRELAMPIRTWASDCPDVSEMVGGVTRSSCNSGSCHDATRRIWLPHTP